MKHMKNIKRFILSLIILYSIIIFFIISTPCVLSISPVNGSQFINQPWNTTFTTFIRALGQGWIILPFSFIGAALFVKTRDTALLSIYLIAIGGLISAGTLWYGFTEVGLLFFVLAAVGIAALMYNVFYGGR